MFRRKLYCFVIWVVIPACYSLISFYRSNHYLTSIRLNWCLVFKFICDRYVAYVGSLVCIVIGCVFAGLWVINRLWTSVCLTFVQFQLYFLSIYLYRFDRCGYVDIRIVDNRLIMHFLLLFLCLLILYDYWRSSCVIHLSNALKLVDWILSWSSQLWFLFLWSICLDVTKLTKTHRFIFILCHWCV